MSRQVSQSSFEDIMLLKRSARDKQVHTVYKADQSSLAPAAEQIQSVLRGVPGSPPGRQRISYLLIG